MNEKLNNYKGIVIDKIQVESKNKFNFITSEKINNLYLCTGLIQQEENNRRRWFILNI